MTETAPVEHIRRRRQAARSRMIRARLVSGGAVCLLGVMVFMAVTMWQRHRAAVARLEGDLRRHFLAPLKAEVLRLEGRLPLDFPGNRVREPGRVTPYRYPDADSVVALRRRLEPIILGYSSRLTPLLGGNAYYAVVFDPTAFQACRDGGEDLAKCLDRCLRVERLDEPTFCRRIEAQNRWLEERARGRGGPVSRRGPRGVAGSSSAA